MQEVIQSILDARVFAVLGASRNPEKYGCIAYRKLKVAGYVVYPINPNASEIDGDATVPSLDLWMEKNCGLERLDCVVTVAPPEITLEAVRIAVKLQVPYIWMQPGSESAEAVHVAEVAGIRVVHGGPCIMVALAAIK